MLLGFLLVGLTAGTFDIVGADGPGRRRAEPRAPQVLAFLALALGLAVKAPMWPLHSWLPDAHTEAPTVGSVLLAGVLLKMGTYGLVRIALPIVPEGARAVAPYLGALAVVGILYGSLACLAQRDLKRLIAFSSVGHMGFVLLGISTLTPVGINGALFANIAHGLITGLLFFLVGAIKDRHHTARPRRARRRPLRTDAAARRAARVRRGRQPRTARPGRLLGRDAGAARRVRPGARAVPRLLPACSWRWPASASCSPRRTSRCVSAGSTRARRTRPGRTQSCCATRRRTSSRCGHRSSLLVVALGLWPGWLLDATDPVVRRLMGGS